MAGSGVNAGNALNLASTGIENLHFTARKNTNSNPGLEMGTNWVPDSAKLKAILDLF